MEFISKEELDKIKEILPYCAEFNSWVIMAQISSIKFILESIDEHLKNKKYGAVKYFCGSLEQKKYEFDNPKILSTHYTWEFEFGPFKIFQLYNIINYSLHSNWGRGCHWQAVTNKHEKDSYIFFEGNKYTYYDVKELKCEGGLYNIDYQILALTKYFLIKNLGDPNDEDVDLFY
jgi:hypothetical protein